MTNARHVPVHLGRNLLVDYFTLFDRLCRLTLRNEGDNQRTILVVEHLSSWMVTAAIGVDSFNGPEVTKFVEEKI